MWSVAGLAVKGSGVQIPVFALGLQHIKDPGQRVASRGRRSCIRRTPLCLTLQETRTFECSCPKGCVAKLNREKFCTPNLHTTARMYVCSRRYGLHIVPVMGCG